MCFCLFVVLLWFLCIFTFFVSFSLNEVEKEYNIIVNSDAKFRFIAVQRKLINYHRIWGGGGGFEILVFHCNCISNRTLTPWSTPHNLTRPRKSWKASVVFRSSLRCTVIPPPSSLGTFPLLHFLISIHKGWMDSSSLLPWSADEGDGLGVGGECVCVWVGGCDYWCFRRGGVTPATITPPHTHTHTHTTTFRRASRDTQHCQRNATRRSVQTPHLNVISVVSVFSLNAMPSTARLWRCRAQSGPAEVSVAGEGVGWMIWSSGLRR